MSNTSHEVIDEPNVADAVLDRLLGGATRIVLKGASMRSNPTRPTADGNHRFVGKDRLDKTGRCWSVPGAERILQLGCLDASRKWDAFWTAKAKKRKQDYFAAKQCWDLAA